MPPTINLLVLRSSDIHRAVHFYRSIGLTFTLEKHGTGPEHYASSAGGFVFELYQIEIGQLPTTSARIGFNVKSVDELMPLLQAAGGEIVSVPRSSKAGRRAIVRDFDGHAVELCTPHDLAAISEKNDE